MTLKGIGDVRPSQVVTTFGPGAIVDLTTLSIVVSGIDRWAVEESQAIHEPRLARALQVKRFFPPKVSEGSFANRLGTIPAFLFPRFQLCPVCRTLSALGDANLEYDPRHVEVVCKATGCHGQGKARATTLPAPFIVACPAGHMDDFPWRDYVHLGSTGCKGRLSLESIARTGSIADILIQCELGHSRPASDAFGEYRATALGPCTQRMPWLGPSYRDNVPCLHAGEVRAMQRGATNAWFPVMRSALAVREAATPLGSALRACNQKQIEKIDSLEKLRALIEMEMFPTLKSFSVEDIWNSIRVARGDTPQADDVDLRLPEWGAFRSSGTTTSDRAELFLQEGEVPPTFRHLVQRVVLARKLLEVRALVGFTRIDTAVGAVDDSVHSNIAPIYRDRPDWLPGVEVRGEGIFVELHESSVAAWEETPAVRSRAQATAKKFNEWQIERGVAPVSFPGYRYVLLHSLAHTLIRQLSLDCGYSASSVRERIYSSGDPGRRMAGILIYTASADSEGSLGGLVDLGSPRRFPELLSNSLRSIARCSSDPLCADHRPETHGTINAAACHACLLASETSCENFNRFLDRNALVPTMAVQDIAYFQAPTPDQS